MKQAADESGKLLMIGSRAASVMTAVVKRFRQRRIWRFRLRQPPICGAGNGAPGALSGDKPAHGGPLIDLGVHVTDLARYLAGNPKPKAAGVTSSLGTAG